MSEMKACIVIPCYNHQSFIKKMLTSLKDYELPCFVIDDGSEKEAAKIIENAVAEFPEVTLFKRPENGGKGAAVADGFRLAGEKGFTHVLQIDADCQHTVSDIPEFIKLAQENPQHIIMGQAVYDESVPKSRLYGRYITHFWVMIETLSFKVLDTMCGFRVYPLEQVGKINLDKVGKRMDFDVEIAVRMIWKGIKYTKLPTKVIYPEDGISNFHYIKGNVRISLMHTRLCLGMFIRIPKILYLKLVS